MRVAHLLVASVLLAGCTGAQIEGLSRGDPPREAWYEEHRGLVAPQHDQRYAFQVDPEARLVNATLQLALRNASVAPETPALPGKPAPTATPARLTVTLLDASGRAVAEAAVDPATPFVSLPVKEIASPGEWTLRVHGTGGSGTVEGQDYGASYLLTLEILYV